MEHLFVIYGEVREHESWEFDSPEGKRMFILWVLIVKWEPKDRLMATWSVDYWVGTLTVCSSGRRAEYLVLSFSNFQILKTH